MPTDTRRRKPQRCCLRRLAGRGRQPSIPGIGTMVFAIGTGERPNPEERFNLSGPDFEFKGAIAHDGELEFAGQALCKHVSLRAAAALL